MSESDDRQQRHSRAYEAELIRDPTEKAEAEARNGLRQYDLGIRAVQDALERGSFRLKPSLILALHREALAGISSFSGNYRPAGGEISGASIRPEAHTSFPNRSKISATTSTQAGTRKPPSTSRRTRCGA
jgi:hypothetical protein